MRIIETKTLSESKLQTLMNANNREVIRGLRTKKSLPMKNARRFLRFIIAYPK